MTRLDSPFTAEQAAAHWQRARKNFACIALVLQGGGALGSYQAGVYEAMAEAGVHPDWVAGISIGAINAAIIAGNAPEERVEKLRGFWQSITNNPLLDWVLVSEHLTPRGDMARGMFNQASAALALAGGASNFFSPRRPGPSFQPAGTLEATSFYDTKALKGTLERFVDFDRINHRDGMHLSVGAVNVRTGNFTYFDNKQQVIRPEHVMASGSLPPGFPATEIDGELYWDGGLISNTPLQWVLDRDKPQDTLVFQIDLWSARGDVPATIEQVMTRQKEIQYSSRTRAGTDQFRRVQRMRYALATLMEKLPADLQDSEEATLLRAVAERKKYNLVHLIYRSRRYEGNSKDYEFSRLTMNEHWLAGFQDAVLTLKHPKIYEAPNNVEGVHVFDLVK